MILGERCWTRFSGDLSKQHPKEDVLGRCITNGRSSWSSRYYLTLFVGWWFVGWRFCSKEIPMKKEDPRMTTSGRGFERDMKIIWILRMVLDMVMCVIVAEICSKYVWKRRSPISIIEQGLHGLIPSKIRKRVLQKKGVITGSSSSSQGHALISR